MMVQVPLDIILPAVVSALALAGLSLDVLRMRKVPAVALPADSTGVRGTRLRWARVDKLLITAVGLQFAVSIATLGFSFFKHLYTETLIADGLWASFWMVGLLCTVFIFRNGQRLAALGSLQWISWMVALFVQLYVFEIQRMASHHHLDRHHEPESRFPFNANPRTVLHGASIVISVVILVTELFQKYYQNIGATLVFTEGRQPSPEYTVSWPARLTFSWFDEMLLGGEKKPLEDKDIWDLVESDKATAAARTFEATKTKQTSLFWRLFETRKKSLIIGVFMQSCYSLLTFRGAFFMFLILRYLQNPAENPYLGWLSAGGLFVTSCLFAVIQGQFQVYCTRIALMARCILVNEIYSKSLTRAAGIGKSRAETKDSKTMFDRSDDDKASYGKIVTIMSSDVNAVRDVIQEAPNDLVALPVEITVGVAGLVALLGWSAGMVGLLVMCVTSPAIAVVYKLAYKSIIASRVATDSRTNITNEAVQNIRVLKYFGWEDLYIGRIMAKRSEELRALVKFNIIWIGMEILRWAGTMGVIFVTFLWYTLIGGHTFTPATAFTAIALLHQVGETINFLPAISMWILRGQVAFKRINDFLEEEDLERYDADARNSYITDDGKLAIASGQFIYMGIDTSEKTAEKKVDKRKGWFRLPWKKAPVIDEEAAPLLAAGTTESPALPTVNEFKLRNINVDFPLGKLSAVVGNTGAGKSSLLLGLLGEMRRVSGTISLPDPREGGVSFASQTAFMMNNTVKENILFGAEFDEERYEAVIDGCALRSDLASLPNGSQTEIGEKGINLSGGQKARISLARAAYSKASIVLLDDPLSAVDASTARHILDHCLLGLLKDRTTIIVTHAVDLVLPVAAFVVCLKDGGIAGSGTLAEVLANPDLNVTIEKEAHQQEEKKEAEDEAKAIETASDEITSSNDSPADKTAKAVDAAASADSKKDNGKKLTEAEGMSRGKVDRGLYLKYFAAAGGIWMFGLFIVGIIANQAAEYGTDWWVKRWTETVGSGTNPSTMNAMNVGSDNCVDPASFVASSMMGFGGLFPVQKCSPEAFQTLDAEQDERDRTVFFITVYGIFNLGVLVVELTTYCLRVFCAFSASTLLHKKLLTATFRSPMRWFETTPSGRIISRFSKDLATIDQPLIQMLHMFMKSISLILCTVVVIGWVVPSSLLALPVLYVVYRKVGTLFVTNSRELKRLDSVTSSPIYSLFGETLVGVSTIRAYGSEARLAKKMQELLDANHRHHFYNIVCSQWFNLRCNFLSAAFIAVVTTAIMMTGLSASWAGLVLSYQMQLVQRLRMTMQLHARVEMQMNAVERVVEYSNNELEPPLINPDYRAPEDWPSAGQVEVTDLVMRYAPDTPDVLKGVSFKTGAHEKVGVVGRTGAGKSTLSLAFLRIVPIAAGSIIIDGIDIGRLGLKDLRTRLTIVPQDPVLFEGTIRTNLDPMEIHTDQELWASVRSVGLVESLERADKAAQAASGDTTTTTAGGASSFSLEFQVQENGSNLSLGQRQLCCLARALLRKSRLIILDEATASIDYFSDALIQKAIRDNFKHATVLTIAHRLRTICDYDRVLVLADGKVAEYDSPSNLMDREGGIFSRMCGETGHMEELRSIANKK
ncbi:hypothetical protein HKX48_009558 [Thoreauomyces humboldtii]|nr:hypothetical protein HKX48_009558 [Thoreauomyces humboldtii]